jgi:hypothetical protein
MIWASLWSMNEGMMAEWVVKTAFLWLSILSMHFETVV